MPTTTFKPPSYHSPPVAIGGMGGSGTRLIAEIMQQLGFYMGSYLNPAIDNLWFTLLFKRHSLWPLEAHQADIKTSIDIFLKAMTCQNVQWNNQEKEYIQKLALEPRPPIANETLQSCALSLLNLEKDTDTQPKHHLHWGWKEPNTHIVLPALLKHIPQMRYIHVMRHGLDMAYSRNQNQLQFWGQQLLPHQNTAITPSNALSYWCEIHRNISKTGSSMGGRFLLLDYDQFCKNPKQGVAKLVQFLNLSVNDKTLRHICTLVKLPKSIGRYKQQPVIAINKHDRQTLQDMGYKQKTQAIRLNRNASALL